jgi:aminotransferase, class IV
MNGDLTIPTLLQGRIALVPTPYSAPLNAIAYEVIRVERGCPLFLQEHLGRLSQSLAVTGQRLPDGNGWLNGLLELFAYEPFTRNVRVDAVPNATGGVDLQAGFIASSYPTRAMYRQGVMCTLLHAERQNPQAKIWQANIRQAADALLEETAAYEAILVDRQDCITEGSRSNIIFLSRKTITTPPAEAVLPGITLSKVESAAKQIGLAWHRAPIAVGELAGYEACAITGTSPGVLPIARLGKVEYAISPELEELRKAYQALCTESMQAFRQLGKERNS